MQACSVVATPWFSPTVIHLIPVRSSRKNSCHYQERKLKKKKKSVGNFCESQETPFSSKHGEENAISDFPLVIRFAKVDLQGIKTWKHLKHQWVLACLVMWHLYDNLAIKYASKDAFSFQTWRYGTFTKQLPAFYRFTFWLKWKNIICNVWVGDTHTSTDSHQFSSISQHTTALPYKYHLGELQVDIPHLAAPKLGRLLLPTGGKSVGQSCLRNPAETPSLQNKLTARISRWARKTPKEALTVWIQVICAHREEPHSLTWCASPPYSTYKNTVSPVNRVRFSYHLGSWKLMLKPKTHTEIKSFSK